MGQLGMKNIRDIERMTLYEYELRKTAYLIGILDTKREIHEQAWANQNVKATKKVGSKEVSCYKNFRDFFDYEKEYNYLMGIEKESTIKNKQIGDLLKKANL